MNNLFEEASLAWEQGYEEKAFKLFCEAAEQGDKNALLNLGYFYDEGIGTSKNKQKALYWYKKAAQNGDMNACTNIAIYYFGLGDFNTAKSWYLDAFNKGDKSAALELAKLGLNGSISLSNSKILEYLQIVMDAKPMIEVTACEQEEAFVLYEQMRK